MLSLRRSKIVATIGPASSSPKILQKLLRSGVDVCRLNLAHGSYSDHARTVRSIRLLASSQRRYVAILADLGGPKVRIGRIRPGTTLEQGGSVLILQRDTEGTVEYFSLNRPEVLKILRPGMRVILDNGNLELRIMRKEHGGIRAHIVLGGTLRSGVGFVVPGFTFPIASLTKKDRMDLRFALKVGVDAIAISFIKRGTDVRRVRALLPKKNQPLLIAKIETPAALQHIDDIITASDGIMVARGDLGLSVPLPEVPHIQKDLIIKTLAAAKPVITATQMLESMVHTPLPTRAEVADITNAILDGTDAVMLSDETARGAHPVEAVEIMSAIAERTDPAVSLHSLGRSRFSGQVADAIAISVVRAAERLGAAAIVVFSESGETARLISRHRPKQPIFVFSPHEHILQQLVFTRGVVPQKIHALRGFEDMLDVAQSALRRHHVRKIPQRFVASAGIPFRQTGTTNLLYVGEF